MIKYSLKGFDNKDREKLIKEINNWMEQKDIEIKHVLNYFRNDKKKWYTFIYYIEISIPKSD